jgi:tetratricopeptide (TPR) repeat protein
MTLKTPARSPFLKTSFSAVFFFGCIGLISLAVFFTAFGMLAVTLGRSGAGAYFLLRAKNMQNKGLENPGVIEYLDWAIILNPQSSEAFHRRCLHHSIRNNDPRAIQDCSRSLELNPKNYLAYLHRGHAYYRSGNYWNAILDYGQVIEKNSSYSGEASYWKGLCYYSMGLYDFAAQDIRQAINKGYETEDSYLWLGWAETRAGDYPSAITSFNKVLNRAHHHIEALVGRGLAYASGGNTNQGLRDMNTALDLDPNNAFIYFNRATVHELMKRYDLAIGDLETVLQTGSDAELHERALFRLKEIRKRLNQTCVPRGAVLRY